jgi:1-deoxy-D-xylulose-5-phosphate synthase
MRCPALLELNPSLLRSIPAPCLEILAGELRDYLLKTVAAQGGHFAANLGVVELTLALHRVFHTPDDALIWDVGHQTYPHKILTGRAVQLPTIRQFGGLSPFAKRSESVFDAFGAGHSSTSISAAIGMSVAFAKKLSKNKVVAIIGDGALTAGMAFEALHHGAELQADVLVILNDNGMSISANVGALSQYLTRLRASPTYATLREITQQQWPAAPLGNLLRTGKEQLKTLLLPRTWFDDLGWDYYGPVDGHDLPTLLEVLEDLRQQSKPRLLHVITQKGKGYAPAEADPIAYHGVKPFNLSNGLDKKISKTKSYSDIFGDWLMAMAKSCPLLQAITPAMCEGSGMTLFAKTFPQRFFDVAIAEQHAITLAAGMAAQGLRPVVAIYSTFLQRAYDQWLHDVLLQHLPVVLAIDRAGVVGADGATHTGNFDVAFLRCLPGMIVAAPSDGQELWRLLNTAYQAQRPFSVRYPRDNIKEFQEPSCQEVVPIGQARVCRLGQDVAILAFGTVLHLLQPLAEKHGWSLADMRFIKPLDENLLIDWAKKHALLVTVEESALPGGAGSAVLEYLSDQGIMMPVLRLGLPDIFPPHGSREAVLGDLGQTAVDFAAAILNRWTQLQSIKEKYHASKAIE